MKTNSRRVAIIGMLLLAIVGILLFFMNYHRKVSAGQQVIDSDFPLHVDCNITDYFLISADVEMSETIRKNGFTRNMATLANCDPQELFDCLDENAKFQLPLNDSRWIQLQGQNGEFINRYSENGITGFDYSDIDDLYLEAAQNGQYGLNPPTLYPMEEAFEHFPIEQCDKRILDILKCFSQEENYMILHQSLSHDVMKDNSYLLHRDDDGSDLLVRDWSENDDTYNCEVFQTIAGVPIINSPRFIGAEDVLDRAPISFSVTENRIVQCRVPQIYLFHSEENRYDLMDFEALMQNVQIIINNQNLDGQHIIVERIVLAAVPVSNGNEIYEIQPVWVFTGHGTEEVEGEQMQWRYGLIIDAVTGNVLVQ